MVPGSLAPFGLVAAGGAVGTLARYGVGALMGSSAGAEGAVGLAGVDTAAWATLVVNLVGAFALGLLFSVVDRVTTAKRHTDRWWLLLGTGVLGGFTTYSGLATEAAELLGDGRVWQALGYAGGTLVAGFVASIAGIWLGRIGQARSA
ncbi:fluoride efflux transporter FluC [Leucobacter sp. HY1910]